MQINRIRNQLQDLQEPLISQESKILFADKFVQPYVQKYDAKPVNSQPEKTAEKPSQFTPYNYYKENEAAIRWKRTDINNDECKFLKQSMAFHEMPTNQIVHFQFHQNDPTIFAVLSRASKFFREDNKDLKLREMICLTDYKNLEKLRIKNYIYVLRLLTKIDPSLYAEVKERLLQIKSLCKYLGMFSQQAKTNEISEVFQKIAKNAQIYDLDEDLTNSSSIQEEALSEKEDDDQPIQEDEYTGFYKQSKLCNQTKEEWEKYQQALFDEEDKWNVRADWLESIIDRFRQSPDENVKSWLSWLESKFEQLANLDIQFKQKYSNFGEENKQVFFFHQYLRTQLKQQSDHVPTSNTFENFNGRQSLSNFNLEEALSPESKAEPQKVDQDTHDQYKSQYQTYADNLNYYPKVQFDSANYLNKNGAFIDQRHNIREKFCLRIQKREAQTEYFLTVFKRRNLGNEKIYEKRLNFDGSAIEVQKIEFNQVSSFLYFSFKLMQPQQQKFDLIFALEAQYKDPLLLKPKTEFFGFFGETSCISYKEETAQVRKKVALRGRSITIRNILPKTEKQQDDKQSPSTEDKQPSNNIDRQNTSTSAVRLMENAMQKVSFMTDVMDFSRRKTRKEKLYQDVQVLRMYEYDLHHFEKVTTVDLKSNEPETDPIKQIVAEKRFGRCEQGFYIIQKKNGTLRKEGNAKIQEYNYVIKIGKTQYPLKLDKLKCFESSDQPTKKKKFIEKISINSKGDRLFVIYQTEQGIRYASCIQEHNGKNSKFHEQEANFDNIYANFNSEDDGKYIYMITPYDNDFVIYASNETRESNNNYIFLNNQFITKYTSNQSDLYFSIQNGQISKLFEVQKMSMMDILRTANNFVYKVFENSQGSEWYQVQHEVYNQQKCVNFPNLFFIYNHDQLYMKDLRSKGNTGFTYLNNFFGIDSKHRPLSILCFNYYHMMCIDIPVVESNYNSQQFNLRVHSIVQNFEMSQPCVFKNTIITYQVYGFNEKLMATVFHWAKIITNNDGNLDNDVRMFWESNVFKIEKWEKGKVIQRVLVTHYFQSRERKERDVTNPNRGHDPSLQSFYKEECYRAVVIQTPEQVLFYSIDCYILTKPFNFSATNSLEPLFTYKIDDPQNPIIDVMIDVMVKTQVHIYILQQNFIMKKFISIVPYGYLYGDRIKFEEFKHQFNLNQIYDPKKSTFNTANKNLMFFETYIVNQIFFSNCIFIDKSQMVNRPTILRFIRSINLDSETFEDKYIKGDNVGNPFFNSLDAQDTKATAYNYHLGFSMNEAKMLYLRKDQQGFNDDFSTRLVEKLISVPLLNTRIIPTFMHKQFKHPIVPLVDLQNGLTTIFTMNIDPKINQPFVQYQGLCYYDGTGKEYYPTLQISKFWRWNSFFNVNPGIIIKYFNGIEERIPIKERFLRITRFNISRNGHYVIMVGSAMGKPKENGLVPIEEGMYIYEIRKDKIWEAKLIHKILFAVSIKQKSQDPKEDSKQVVDAKNNYDGIIQDLNKQGNSKLSIPYKNRIYLKQTELGYQVLCDQITVQNQTDAFSGSLQDGQIKVFEFKDPPEEKPASESTEVKSVIEQDNLARQKIRKRMGLVDEVEQKVFSKFHQLFEGFDIPRYPFKDGILNYIEDLDDSKIDKNQKDKALFVNKNYFDQAKKIEKNKEDYDYIAKVHNNIHLQINEQGHIFLINRVTNKLYFFYEDSVTPGKLNLFKFQMDDKIKMTNADSGGKFLIAYSQNAYKIFNIEHLLNPSTSQQVTSIQRSKSIMELISNAEVQKDRIEIMNLTQKHNGTLIIDMPEIDLIQELKKKQLQDSQMLNAQEEKKQQLNEIQKYSCTIFEAYIHKNKAIFKFEDGTTKYLKIYDLDNQVLLNYIEFDQLMISGCKRYIWFVLKNQVYNIENNLSTLFLWPGGDINHLAYDCQDIFNISSDQTIMATFGLLYLSFEYHSCILQPPNQSAVVGVVNDNHFKKLFYKLSPQLSVMDFIFKEPAVPKDSKKTEAELQKDKEVNIIFQQQLMQKLLNNITSKFNNQTDNPIHIALFLLSFQKEIEIKDDQNQIQEEAKQPNQNDSSKVNNEVIVQKEQKICNIFELLFSHENPRYDIIEDILSFIVKSLDLPIIQNVINKSFLNFLEKADTSKAFKEYLEKGIFKTKRMSNIDKYPIQSTEQGYRLGSSVSPIMDENFHKEFQDVNESKKDVEISFIYFGDLLSKNGREIMNQLSDDRYLDLMSIPFIKYLVLFQFQQIENMIQRKTLYPFYSLLALYSIYSIFLVGYVDDQEGVGHLSFAEQIIYEVLVILIICNLFYFLYTELKDCLQDYKDYFSSFWNLSDLLSYSLCLLSVFIDVLKLPNLLLRPIGAISVIILWIKLFYFLRVYDSTSQLIRMIIAIVNDMKNFMIVLLIGIIGFTCGLYIMQQGLDGKLEPDEMDNERFVGANPVKAFIYTYRMTLGDFQLDSFQVFDDKGMHYEFYLIWAIFIFGSLFLVIVLLNLLIAIMGETFARVSGQLVNLSIQEKVLLVSENEFLFDRLNLFKNAKYLIIISEKKVDDNSQQENLEANITSLKSTLVDKVTKLETELKGQLTETQKELKRKFQEQDQNTKKIAQICEQLNEEVKALNAGKTLSKQQNVDAEQEKRMIEEMKKMVEEQVKKHFSVMSKEIINSIKEAQKGPQDIQKERE